jgi:hypothetical protein
MAPVRLGAIALTVRMKIHQLYIQSTECVLTFYFLSSQSKHLKQASKPEEETSGFRRRPGSESSLLTNRSSSGKYVKLPQTDQFSVQVAI